MGFREFLIELTGALIKEDCNKNVTTINISLKYEIWDGYIKIAYFFIYTPYKKCSTYIRRMVQVVAEKLPYSRIIS